MVKSESEGIVHSLSLATIPAFCGETVNGDETSISISDLLTEFRTRVLRRATATQRLSARCERDFSHN